MSVLIPDKNVFNYVGHSIDRCIFGVVVDQWFHNSMRQHFNKGKDIDAEQVRLVESWMRLNDLSFSLKYGEKPERSIKWKRSMPHKDICLYQLKKYIECIYYNIELCTIKEKGVEVTDQMTEDTDLLRKWSNDIAHAVVGMVPEYQDAEWSK